MTDYQLKCRKAWEVYQESVFDRLRVDKKIEVPCDSLMGLAIRWARENVLSFSAKVKVDNTRDYFVVLPK